jgi:hypothetical protein
MTHAPVRSRLARILRIGLLGSAAAVLLLLVPDLGRLLYRAVPWQVRWYWGEELALVLLLAYGATWCWVRPRPRAGNLARRARDRLARLDSLDERTLSRATAIVLGLVCAGCVAVWIPHYLTWPWSRDEDTFAVLAQSWDRGILPYRDIRAYNFPGETYLFWVLGKVFGWGRTAPFYALDASFVVVLGVVLFSWSRQRLGGAAAGLFAFLAFLKFYLSQPFETTGERDWHTAFFVCLGLLALQAWPGRWSRIASAMLTALALSIRPHAVLFLPALASAVVEPESDRGPAAQRRARAILEWLLWLSGFVFALFAPLIVAGIFDDLIRGLGVASYGGPYSKVTPVSAFESLVHQLLDWRTDVPLAATILLAICPEKRLSRVAQTWSWAWLGALLYRAIHPVQHRYLIHPVLLVGSITWALPISYLLSARWMATPVRLLVIAWLAYEIVPSPPFMCSPSESAEALQVLVRGETPPDKPLGAAQAFDGGGKQSFWLNYCALLTYLRQKTGPETLVANVLNRYPYESLNGPAGRLSPFRAESGICWLSWVDLDLDPEFAQDLERATDSVVVWEPAQFVVDPKMKLERVIGVVRRLYEPEARFGAIELWRHKPTPIGPQTDPDEPVGP